MTADEVCAAVRRGIPALYECTAAPQSAVRIRTPFMYPDGDLVDLFALDRPDGLLLTDFGDTLGWLGMQSTTPRLGNKQHRLAADACRSLGVRLEAGHLVLRAIGEADLGEAVQRLALAAVRVSDLWFTMRAVAARPRTQEEVSDWLEERQIRFERRVVEMGRSGRRWRVDYRTHAGGSAKLVFLLSTGATRAARGMVEHVLAGCVDLSLRREHNGSASLVSLFDDKADVWRDEDFALVEQNSTVARWSRPDELEAILRPSGERPTPWFGAPRDRA